MKIAVIAWGSLVWDPRELLIHGNFKPKGPTLPLEFARISKDGRLTLAISKRHGILCRSYSATSKYFNLNDALLNLYFRETGAIVKKHWDDQEVVAYYVRGKKIPNQAQYKIMADWLNRPNNHDYDAVIWTSLKMKFYEKTKVIFSPKSAIKYLMKLEPEAKSRALEYIDNAPPEIRTHVRALTNLYRTIGML